MAERLAAAGFDFKPKELLDILDLIASERQAAAEAKAKIEAEKTPAPSTVGVPVGVINDAHNDAHTEGVGGPKVVHSDKPVEKAPEPLPPSFVGLVRDDVWASLTLDERRSLELYFIMNAMWHESGFMKGRVSVLQAGRKVSVDASLPLAKEVYDAYSKSHDQKTFEKLLVDHNMDLKKIVEWTQSTSSGPQKQGSVDAIVPPSDTSSTPQGAKSSSNSASKPSDAPNASTTTQNNGSESGLPFIPVSPLDEFMAKTDEKTVPENGEANYRFFETYDSKCV